MVLKIRHRTAAVAAWQPGESSIGDYQEAFGSVFHGDASGKVNEAERQMMAAFAALAKAKTDMTSDELFWVDPWSAQGQAVSTRLLPQAREMRSAAERAILLVAQARAANPALREHEALAALDLGARRLDLIGLKFELAQEIADTYAQAVAQQHDKARRSEMRNILDEISSMFGRCQDLRDAYSAARAEYSQVWLSENRPYWLNNVTVRYDIVIEDWQRRANCFNQAERDWDEGKELPATACGVVGAR